MARNRLYRLVQQKCWEEAQEWGALSDELRPLISDIVQLAIASVVAGDALKKKIEPQLAWDIMLICFEYRYRHIVEPSFYLPLLDGWYAIGHFPCGWNGAVFPEPWDGLIPEGKLIVF